MLSSKGGIRIDPGKMQTADIGFFAWSGQLQFLCEVKCAFWVMSNTTNAAVVQWCLVKLASTIRDTVGIREFQSMYFQAVKPTGFIG